MDTINAALKDIRYQLLNDTIVPTGASFDHTLQISVFPQKDEHVEAQRLLRVESPPLDPFVDIALHCTFEFFEDTPQLLPCVYVKYTIPTETLIDTRRTRVYKSGQDRIETMWEYSDNHDLAMEFTVSHGNLTSALADREAFRILPTPKRGCFTCANFAFEVVPSRADPEALGGFAFCNITYTPPRHFHTDAPSMPLPQITVVGLLANHTSSVGRTVNETH